MRSRNDQVGIGKNIDAQNFFRTYEKVCFFLFSLSFTLFFTHCGGQSTLSRSTPMVELATLAPTHTAAVLVTPTKSPPTSTPSSTATLIPTANSRIAATNTQTPIMAIPPISETQGYLQLPKINLVSPASLIASPLHPTSFLNSDLIRAGEEVRVLARNNDGSWLLIANEDIVGWIPRIYVPPSSNQTFPVLPTSNNEGCSGYLGSSFHPGEPWENTVDNELLVQGVIVQTISDESMPNPSITIVETGATLTSEFSITQISENSRILQFSSIIENLNESDSLTFQIDSLQQFPTMWLATFYTTDCVISPELQANSLTNANGIVTSEILEIWNEPEGADVNPIGNLKQGDQIALTGFVNSNNSNHRWWRIILSSGKEGWVNGQFINASGCIDCVPEVPRTIVLRVETEVSPISRLLLINAPRNTVIETLVDGAIIRLNQLNTRLLNIEAIVGDTEVKSVIFYLDGQIFCANGRCLENVAPYAMAGDINGDHYDNWNWQNLVGKHTISVFGCDEANGRGNCGTPYTISFTVID